MLLLLTLNQVNLAVGGNILMLIRPSVNQNEEKKKHHNSQSKRHLKRPDLKEGFSSSSRLKAETFCYLLTKGNSYLYLGCV